MHLFVMTQAILASAFFSNLARGAGPSNFPSTYVAFSSNFTQPPPPLVAAEYKASWKQHKWNVNISHIASGYIYASPSQGKVRVDEAWDGSLASSLFDYSNITENGVSNKLWTLSPAITSPPSCFSDYVANPAFPLIQDDFLVTSNAVFAGVVQDPWAGEVAAWNLLYANTIPATVYLDNQNIVQGYNYWATDERTHVITRFDNIVIGNIDPAGFTSLCQ